MAKDKIILSDEAVLPVMEKHNIGRDEAEKRLHLLFESGILKHGDPTDPTTQRLIDGFLAQDSETLTGAVAYEKMFTACIDNADLVRQYDRLHHTNFAKAIRKANIGLPPTNFKRQMEGFEKFCQDTIFSRLTKVD